MAETTDIRFAGWVLRRSAGELVRGSTCIRLQEQPLQILEHLLTQPGELVSREQLIAKLWPTGVVDFDTGLNTAMRKLRIALSDDAETPRYIETIPRRGYRFIGRIDSREGTSDTGVHLLPADATVNAAAPYVADSTTAPPAAAQSRMSRRAHFIAWAGATLLLGTAIVGAYLYTHSRTSQPEIAATIVVLPFVDMSAEQQDQAFCDGLSEELSNWLAQIPSLRVVSRTSAFSYKGKSIDARQVGKELNATHVLEGSVRRNGKDVRVTAQLINAKDGFHLWSKSFDMPLGNVLQVQDQVSQAVTASLEIRLTDVISARIAGRHPQNVNAYELYLLAQHYYRLRTAEGNARAIALGQQAIGADPTFALAYAALAAAKVNEVYFSNQVLADAAVETESLLEKALKLNPNLAEGLTVRGQLRRAQNNLSAAEQDLRRALAINPNIVDAYDSLAKVYEQKGDLRGTLDSYAQAAALDPLDYMRHVRLCTALRDASRFQEATTACARAYELNANARWAPWATSWLAKAQGNLVEALQWNALELKVAPESADAYEDRYSLFLDLDMYADADAALKSATALYGADAANQLLPTFGILASQGPKALATYLAHLNLDAAADADLLYFSARLFALVGNTEMAEGMLARAAVAPQLDQHRLRTFTDMKWGTADEITVALIARGKGNQAELAKSLQQLMSKLDKLESDGSHTYGIDVLRGEAHALRGDANEAMRHLDRAVKSGWRVAWMAKANPSLSGLRQRKDFQDLIASMERSNAQARAALKQ